MRDTLGRDVATERRACRVLGQARNTQRRKACVGDDEPQLMKRIVWMATEYGRYGYRRIKALVRAEGWWVNHKRVERIWRQEGRPGQRPMAKSVREQDVVAALGNLRERLQGDVGVAAQVLKALVGDVVVEARKVEGKAKPEMVARFTIYAIPAMALLTRGQAAKSDDPTVTM